jgi:hypothetical protein
VKRGKRASVESSTKYGDVLQINYRGNLVSATVNSTTATIDETTVLVCLVYSSRVLCASLRWSAKYNTGQS